VIAPNDVPIPPILAVAKALAGGKPTTSKKYGRIINPPPPPPMPDTRLEANPAKKVAKTGQSMAASIRRQPARYKAIAASKVTVASDIIACAGPPTLRPHRNYYQEYGELQAGVVIFCIWRRSYFRFVVGPSRLSLSVCL